jgi:regulator of sigma E protease
MSVILYIAVALLILVLMITIHEVGHYVAGKVLGFKINEFAIGFGKPLFKRTNPKTGETFSIRMIPLGGFCAFHDDAADSITSKDNEANKDAKGFGQMAPWRRLIVLFAGAFCNFVSAIIFAVVLLMVVGYSQVTVLHLVDDRSPNVIEGRIQAGDTVVSINGKTFSLLTPMETVLNNYNLENAGEGTDGMLFVIRRNVDGTVVELEETVYMYRIPPATQGGTASIGVGLPAGTREQPGRERVFAPMAFGVAVGHSFVFCFELAHVILEFLWQLITLQHGLSGIGGPVTTVSVITMSVSQDLLNILLLIPFMGVNLAVFNLLPFPALDGARMVFVTIEWIRRKPIDPKIEGRIHMFGLLFLFGLVIMADLRFIISGGLSFMMGGTGFIP